jgi:FkbM family methyltransferase
MLIMERVIGRLGRVSTHLLRYTAKFLGRAECSIPIKGAGRVKIRTNSTDHLTFAQVFWYKEYDFSRSAQYEHVMDVYRSILAAQRLPIIVDAGANVGAASIWFAMHFPGARILAVEPDPGNAGICRLNVRRFSGVKLIEAAIGSERGVARLENPENEAWAVQTIRGDRGGIPICTIPDLVLEVGEEAQLFLVKIDIEGFEQDLFKTNTGWIDDAAVIIIEPHDWLFPGKGTSLNLQRVMGKHNFEILISMENLIFVQLPTRIGRKGDVRNAVYTDE